MEKQRIDIMEQQVQPHDTDTEQAVLSTLIHYNDKILQYGDMLEPSMFYFEREREMFRCIIGVVNDGGITDINSLYNYSQAHKMNVELYREDFVNIIQRSNKATLDQDIRRLRDLGRRRKCWRMLMETSHRIFDLTNDMDDEINAAWNMISDMQGESGASNIVSNDDTLHDIRKDADENRHGKTNALKTGFSLFDSRFVFRPDTMTVIAAFTSVGKSALAMNIVQAVARQGVPCAYYSLEMSRKELASRGISRDAELTASAIVNKALTDEQLQKLDGAINKNMGLPIYYDDSSTVDFDRTIRSIRQMVKTKGVRLAVIDYLQVYAQQMDDAEQSISYMARTAKNVAKELGIAVIVISQLNRSGLHPTIKMLRGSGQIEESADNVILIDRPEAYPDNKVTKYEGEFKDASVRGTAKFILAKGRGVGTGSQLVAFDGKHTQFTEITVNEAGNYEEQNDALPF